MHQQSLMLLHPMIKEKMHLQEKHYLTLTLGWITLTRNVAHYPQHNGTYALPKFDIATSHG